MLEPNYAKLKKKKIETLPAFKKRIKNLDLTNLRKEKNQLMEMKRYKISGQSLNTKIKRVNEYIRKKEKNNNNNINKRLENLKKGGKYKNRVVRTGQKGGQYIIRKGRKEYLPRYK